MTGSVESLRLRLLQEINEDFQVMSEGWQYDHDGNTKISSGSFLIDLLKRIIEKLPSDVPLTYTVRGYCEPTHCSVELITEGRSLHVNVRVLMLGREYSIGDRPMFQCDVFRCTPFNPLNRNVHDQGKFEITPGDSRDPEYLDRAVSLVSGSLEWLVRGGDPWTSCFS